MRKVLSILLLANFCNAFSNGKNDSLIHVFYNKLSALESFECNIVYKTNNPGELDTTVIHRNIKFYKNGLDSIIGYSYVQYDKPSEKTHGFADFYDGIYHLTLDYDDKIFYLDQIAYKPKSGLGGYGNPIIIKKFLDWLITSKTDYTIITIPNVGYRLLFHSSYPILLGYKINIFEDVTQTSITIDFDNKFQLPRQFTSYYIQPDSSRMAYMEGNIKDYKSIVTALINPHDSLPVGFESERKIAISLQASKGTKAKNFKLKQLDSDSVELYKLKSDFVLIEFSSMYCGSSVYSIPLVRSLRDSVSADKLKIISIENTKGINLDVYRRHYQKEKFNYPLLINGSGVAKIYNARGTPTFFLLDKNKTIIDIIEGFGESAIVDLLRKINK